MTDNNQAFAILRHTEVNRVQKSILDNIVQLPELIKNIIKVRSVAVEKPADILKKPEVRIDSSNRFNEYRESVAGVLGAELFTADTERLARRSTYNNLRRRVDLINVKPGTITASCKIAPIGFSIIRLHFVACRVYTAGFKTKRQTSAPGKKIKR